MEELRRSCRPFPEYTAADQADFDQRCPPSIAISDLIRDARMCIDQPCLRLFMSFAMQDPATPANVRKAYDFINIPENVSLAKTSDEMALKHAKCFIMLGSWTMRDDPAWVKK